MSQPNFDSLSEQPNTVLTEVPTDVKRPLDLYTLMILISFLAMLVGTILLLWELSRWGDFSTLPWSTDAATPSTGN